MDGRGRGLIEACKATGRPAPITERQFRFTLAFLPPVILNLGCGTRTSPATVNIDWSPYLRAHQSPLGRRLAPLVLGGRRLQAFQAIDSNVVVHDLRKGIPAATGSADAVYHSHVLEHIDRDQVPGFFTEVLRVLKPGGIHRIVVPDFGRIAREYIESLEHERQDHEDSIAALIEQSVRREASGTSHQRPLLRSIENLVLGDARKRGETHQWGWDRVNLRQALEQAGFDDFAVVSPTESRIHGWVEMNLDTDPDGTVHKAGSLWTEARKPGTPPTTAASAVR